MGSDIYRLRAKFDMRKEIVRDYKDKYHRVAEELLKIKLDANVSQIPILFNNLGAY
jgi:hypothetical protein